MSRRKKWGQGPGKIESRVFHHWWIRGDALQT